MIIADSFCYGTSDMLERIVAELRVCQMAREDYGMSYTQECRRFACSRRISSTDMRRLQTPVDQTVYRVLLCQSAVCSPTLPHRVDMKTLHGRHVGELAVTSG